MIENELERSSIERITEDHTLTIYSILTGFRFVSIKQISSDMGMAFNHNYSKLHYTGIILGMVGGPGGGAGVSD